MSQKYPSDWDSRRQKVYKRDNYTCQNCGAKGGASGNVELQAHHIVPKSKGGTHQATNLVTVCSDCHDAIHGSVYAPTAPEMGWSGRSETESEDRTRADKKLGGCICCGKTGVLEKQIKDWSADVICSYCKARYEMESKRWVTHYRLVEGNSDLVGYILRPKEWKYLNNHPGEMGGVKKEVYDAFRENLDGESFHRDYLEELTLLELVGIADPGEFATSQVDDSYDRTSIEGTILDPEHEVWNSYNEVNTYFDTTKEIESVINELVKDGLVSVTQDGKNSFRIEVEDYNLISKKKIAEEMQDIPLEKKAPWSNTIVRILAASGIIWFGGLALLFGNGIGDITPLIFLPAYLLPLPFAYYWLKDNNSAYSEIEGKG